MLCQLAPGTRPSMTFLFVGSLFCLRLPPDPSSRKRPCLWLVVLHHSAPKLTSIWMAGSPTGDLHPISSRPCWAYTIRLERTDKVSWWCCRNFSQTLSRNVTWLLFTENHLSCRTQDSYPTQSDRTPSATAFRHFERVNMGLVGRSHLLQQFFNIRQSLLD